MSLALLLVGCTSDAVSKNNNEVSPEVMRQVNELFSEENWEKMEILFDSVEYELVRFIDYLKASDLLESLQGRTIYFPAISGDDILNQNSPAGIFLLMRDSPEFFEIMKNISEQSVIKNVFITRGQNIQIVFAINEEHTPFTTAIHGGPNFFRYVGEGGATPVRFEVRKVRDGWYMDMSPPHGFH